MLDQFLNTLPIILLFITFLKAPKLIRSNKLSHNIIGFFLVGMCCSLTMFWTFGMVFGFIPVLLNSVIVPIILKERLNETKS